MLTNHTPAQTAIEGNWRVWWECGKCRQEYSGETQMGLAQAWCEQVAGLPDDDDEKLEAASLALGHRPPSLRPQPNPLACRHLAILRTR